MTYPHTATTEIAKMHQTARITENNPVHLDSIIDDAVQETLQQEEEMKKREN
jgi:hypothetical protein